MPLPGKTLVSINATPYYTVFHVELGMLSYAAKISLVVKILTGFLLL